MVEFYTENLFSCKIPVSVRRKGAVLAPGPYYLVDEGWQLSKDSADAATAVHGSSGREEKAE